MARALNRLSVFQIAALEKRGCYADGGGLYLQVAKGGSKSWVFRYERDGRRSEMGLGPLSAVTLKVARQKAAEARQVLVLGQDPLAGKRAARAARRAVVTFREAGEAFIAAHAPAWRNAKHVDQWRSTLATYAYPVLGDLGVGDVDTALVLKVLEPIWTKKTRRRSGCAAGSRTSSTGRRRAAFENGDNPARWRGHLDKLLARPNKVMRVRHFAALPYPELPAFFAELQEQDGIAARAMAFCILTATRTGEVIGCRTTEIKDQVWTIPAERTKSGREHRVPLSPPAASIVTQMTALPEGPFLFPGGRRGKPLSNMAMAAVLKRMGRDAITVHGFRSAFRDWCRERTNFPREVAEAALGHVLCDKTEAACARGDMLAKRAQLMVAWARYCTTPPAGRAVVALSRQSTTSAR